MGSEASDVIMGGAAVEIGTIDQQYFEGLRKAEARLKAFAAAAMAIGARLSGFGIGLGTGIITAAKAFASTGKELDTVNAKLKLVDKSSPEFEKLSKESERLTKIMGGSETAAAVKLATSFGSLGDSIKGVVVTFGAQLAPAVSKMVAYVQTGVEAVRDFIRQHKELAPQAAVVVAGLTAVGLAITALGVMFYALGPVIKLSMGIGTIAMVAFSLASGTVTTAVAVASVGLKILTGTVLMAAAAWRFLNVTTISASVVMTTLNVAVKAVGITVAFVAGAMKAFAICVVFTSAKLAIATMVMGSFTIALRNMMISKTIFGSFSLLSKAIGFLMSPIGQAVIAIGALIAIGGPLVYAILKWTDAGQYLAEAFSKGFEIARNAVVSAFNGILAIIGTTPGAVSAALSGVADMAKQAFGGVVTFARSAFESGRAFFMDLFGTAKTTFQGISDAVAAGDMQMAMDILWAGWSVAWNLGCDGLKAAWQASMIYIETGLDTTSSNLMAIWDVAIAYMEGAFDRLMTGVRNKMQDVSGAIAKFIAKTGVFGKVDEESLNEELNAQREKINGGADQREKDRNDRIAKAGDDEGFRKRQEERNKRLEGIGGESEALKKARERLAKLRQEAAEAAKGPKPTEVQMDELRKGVGSGTKQAVAAQARDSAGAASTVAAAVNATSLNPQVVELKKANQQLKDQNKFLEQIASKKAVQFIEIQ